MAERHVFPDSIKSPSSNESLQLLGHGVTDMTIETIHVVFTRVGVYFGEGVRDHLQSFRTQPVDELLKEGSQFYTELLSAPVSKLIKIHLVKKQLGSQYASTVETSIRDKLAYDDKFEEDEEEALAQICEFFQARKLEPESSIAYSWSGDGSHVEVFVYEDDPAVPSANHCVKNLHVAKAVLEWILGENSFTPSTVESVAQTVTSQF